jgi:D-serine dehydratase
MNTTDLTRHVDWRMKGFPACAHGVSFDALADLNLSLLAGDLPLPCAVLRDSSVRHNREWMRAFLGATGLRLAPHGKTTMSPEIFAMQTEDGVWGLTAATAHHVTVYHRLGIRRVLMANQLVGPANIASVLGLLQQDPTFEVLCLVDSVLGATDLAAAVRERGMSRPLRVLVEIGARGGRTGVRGPADALDLVHTVRGLAPWLEFAGLETYEGIAVDGLDGLEVTRRLTADVLSVLNAVHARGWAGTAPMIVSAGGSALFDLVADALAPLAGDRRVEVVLRSGCYVVHDSGSYARSFAAMRARSASVARLGEGLRPALEVWADVQSIPEPGRLIAGLGKRDVSYDIDLPRPTAWFRRGVHLRPQPVPTTLTPVNLYDQHVVLSGPTADLRVGDSLIFGISHPCTTFDKWRAIPVVDEAYRVVSAIATLF